MKLRNHELSIQVGSKKIKPAKVVRVLGVQLDDEVYVAKMSAACYCHLRRLRQIRLPVGAEIKIRLVLALIMSRIDYCNSVLAGVPHSTFEPLQQVQNAAARLIHHLDARDHVGLTPSMMQLRWLSIRWRIHFKLCRIMYTVHRCMCPVYTCLRSCRRHEAQQPALVYDLLSQTSVMSRLRTEFGEPPSHTQDPPSNIGSAMSRCL